MEERQTYLLRIGRENFKQFKLRTVKNDTNMDTDINEFIKRYLETEIKKEAL
jgi:hypothetical protein